MSLTKVSYSMINGAPANVLDFGADPTGAADSYAAFLAAYNSGAGTIEIPLGTFWLSQTFVIDRAVIVNGASSANTRDMLPVNTSLIYFTGTGPAFELIGSDPNSNRNMHIRNISIKGTSAGSAGISIGTNSSSFVSQSSFINIQIRNFSAINAAGINVARCLDSYFRNVMCMYGYDGIKIKGVNTTLIFDDCWCSSSARYGWNVDAIVSGEANQGLTFRGCIADNSQSSGLYITGYCTYITVHDWFSEGNCIATGFAPQAIIYVATNYRPSYITIYGGVFSDYVSTPPIYKIFHLEGAGNVTFSNIALNNGPGSIEIDATTSDCALFTSYADFRPSFITGNHLNGMSINGNAPWQYTNTIPDSGGQNLPSTTGTMTVTDITNNYSAIFFLNGARNAVSLVSDPDGKFAAGVVAGKLCITYSGNYQIINLTGNTLTYLMQFSMTNIY